MMSLTLLAALGAMLSQDAGRTAVGIGLTPAVLAASGADAADAQAMLAELSGEQQLISQFREAVADCSAKRSAFALARDAVRKSPHDQQARASLATATQELEQVEAIVTGLSNQLKAACLEGADPQMMDRAANFRENGPRRAPPEFKVLTLSDEAWSELCDALVTLRRADRLGESPPAQAKTLVLSRQAEAAVVAAAQGLAENLAPIRQQFWLAW